MAVDIALVPAPQPVGLRDADILNMLLESDYNVELVAENTGLSQPEVYSLIANNGAVVTTHLRTLATMRTFRAVLDTQQAMLEKLDDMEPADAGKTFTNLLHAFSDLTKNNPTTQPGNVNNTQINLMLQSLPPNMRNMVEELVAMDEGEFEETASRASAQLLGLDLPNE